MQDLGNANYSSLTEFLESLREFRNPDNKGTTETYCIGDCAEPRGKWLGAGCKRGRDVQNKIAKGWPEGQKRVGDLLGDLNIDVPPKDRRRRPTKCELGDSVDIGSIYAGRFSTAWTRAKRRSGLGPQRVDIVANMICSGGDDSDVLFWRGAAAVVLADKLESAGYMVRLVVGFGGKISANDEKVSCRIVVKAHDMPLDICSTSAVLMPGFFRALGHGWSAGHSEKYCSSPSMSVEACKLEKGEYFLSHQIRDKQSAIQWITDTITAVNNDCNGEAAA